MMKMGTMSLSILLTEFVPKLVRIYHFQWIQCERKEGIEERKVGLGNDSCCSDGFVLVMKGM